MFAVILVLVAGVSNWGYQKWHNSQDTGTKVTASPGQQELHAGHVTVFDGFRHFDRSGFNFEMNKLVKWDSGKADILVSNYESPEPYALLFAQNETLKFSGAPQDEGANSGIQEMPETRLDDVEECPVSGYQVHWVKATVNGVYCVRMRDGKHYAKIMLTDVEIDRIAFDWIYQPSDSRRFQ